MRQHATAFRTTIKFSLFTPLVVATVAMGLVSTVTLSVGVVEDQLINIFNRDADRQIVSVQQPTPDLNSDPLHTGVDVAQRH